MTITLPITTPRIETPYARPLLSLSSHVTDQSAGTAIRNWWHRVPAPLRAREGIVLDRGDIFHRNNDVGAKAIPLRDLTGADDANRPVLLALFSDQSACVLRGTRTHANPEEARIHAEGPDVRYQLLPVVLRLSSVARPVDDHPVSADGRGALRLKMRGGRNPVLALERETDSTGWINIEASWTSDLDGLTYEVRQVLVQDLMREAAAWASQIDSLPALVTPHRGQAFPFTADADQTRELGLDSGTDIGLPCAVPWLGYTTDEQEALRDFAKEIARWMQVRTGNVCRNIDVEIDSLQPSQKARKAPARARVVCIRHDEDKDLQEQMNAELTSVLQDILASDLPPAPMDRFVGQVERDWKNRRTWLAPERIANVFAPSQEAMSNHEQLRLRGLFDRFWPSA